MTAIPRLKLYGYPNSRSLRAAWALEEAGATYDYLEVDLPKGAGQASGYLAINPGGIRAELEGEETRDPAFGLPALWITEDLRERAERLGYTVVDPPSIIATHLTEIIKKHAAEILGRQELQSILDALKRDYPAVVEDVQKHLSLGRSRGLCRTCSGNGCPSGTWWPFWRPWRITGR